MAQARIGTSNRQGMLALGLIEHTPGRRKQHESTTDQQGAEDVEKIPVWVTLPAKQGPPEVSRIMRQEVQPWIKPAQPSCQQVDGQREAIHLGKQRYQKSRKGPKRAPVTRTVRVRKTEREDDEHRCIEYDERPETVGRGIRVHYAPPCGGRCWCTS